ncbi:MAG: hydroxymethylbilane synthase, partial [Alphaproteobacteria bacterium]
IGVEARDEDEGIDLLLESINYPKSRREVTLDSAVITVSDGSCKTPIAGYARTTPEGRILFEGCALSPDGRTRYDVAREADARDLAAAAAIGHAAGEELLARAGRAFFQV